MVGTLDDIKVVLDDDNGVPPLNQGVEGGEQFLDVVEMESRSGLIKDEHGGDRFFLTEVVGQFDALVLAAGKGAGGLSQFDVTQSDVLKGLHSLHNLLLPMLCEELDGLVDGHVQDVIDGLLMEQHVEDFLLEPAAMAGFAFQDEVVHELHLNGDGAFALAFLTPAALGIEGEEGRRVAHLLG